jgi:hypothetical protein
MPVVVDGQYEWTKYLTDAGAIRATGAEIPAVIDGILCSYKSHDRRLLEAWSRSGKQLWTNLIP